MDAATESGIDPMTKHHIQPEYGDMSGLLRAGTTEPISRDPTLRRKREQGKTILSCSSAGNTQGS